jgi:hypothetical protein
MKLKKMAVALGMALSIVGASAQAAVLSFEDDNIDFLLNSDGTAKTSGTLANGDILVSIFTITTYTIDGVNGIPAGQELTGVAAIQLTGGTGTVADPWTFTSTSLGLNTWSDTDLTAFGGGANGGATVAMFLNSTTPDLNITFGDAVGNAASCTSLTDCVTAATNGTLLQVDGFFGDDDEFWESIALVAGGGDVGVVGGSSGALNVASFNAAQTTAFNLDGTVAFQDIATGTACPTGTAGLDGCVSGPVLSGPIKGGAGLNDGIKADGAFARSDFDITKLTAVPEPGTLALLGGSLFGLFGIKRRKN